MTFVDDKIYTPFTSRVSCNMLHTVCCTYCTYDTGMELQLIIHSAVDAVHFDVTKENQASAYSVTVIHNFR